MNRWMRYAALALMGLAMAGCNVRPVEPADPPPPPKAEAGRYQTQVLAQGLANPWGLAVLPDGALLVTERGGALKRIPAAGGPGVAIAGVPAVFAQGQGGLLDVALHPQFATNGLIYLTMAVGRENANHTRLVRAKLVGDQLETVETLWDFTPAKRGPAHFGSRLLWLPDGTLLVSVGDGFAFREQAQNLTTHFGKIVRLTEDGKPAPGNPFAGSSDALADIYSYGHRNVQGLVRDPVSGRIYAHEHGPMGGDELNLVEPGKNYGWPAATFGKDYSGAQISPFTERPGMVGPLKYWVPSIAPGGMAFYAGDAFPAWRGDVLVAGLRSMDVRRVDLDADGKVLGEESLFAELNARVRQVVVGPAGELYLLTDAADGAVIKVTPKR
jgi:aldose sugar dehydrogenase